MDQAEKWGCREFCGRSKKKSAWWRDKQLRTPKVCTYVIDFELLQGLPQERLVLIRSVQVQARSLRNGRHQDHELHSRSDRYG